MIVELPHGGVVARLGSNEELTIGVHGGIGIQKLLKDGWGEFAPATAAMGEARQTNCLIVHDLVTPLSSIASWSALPNPTLKRRLP